MLLLRPSVLLESDAMTLSGGIAPEGVKNAYQQKSKKCYIEQAQLSTRFFLNLAPAAPSLPTHPLRPSAGWPVHPEYPSPGVDADSFGPCPGPTQNRRLSHRKGNPLGPYPICAGRFLLACAADCL